MSDLIHVKAMLVDALARSATNPSSTDVRLRSRSLVVFSGGDGCSNHADFDADDLAATVTAHFLDREKVRSALVAMILKAVPHKAIVGRLYGTDYDSILFGDAEGTIAGTANVEDLTDRLIAALAGPGDR